MKLNEYQNMSKRTLPKTTNKIEYVLNLSNYAMGLAGESGEVIDVLKKHLHHKHPLNRESAINELGDALHYLAGIATMLDLTLEEIGSANINKLKERYPNGFTAEDSINRSN